MLERWPQVCRVKITFALLTTNRFVSTTTNSMKCLVNWILLRIRVRSTNTQLHLNTHTYYYTHTQIYAHIEQQQGAKCASNWALFRLMCVCITHNHHCVCEGIKHTYASTPRHNREDTDKHPYLSFCQKRPPTPATKAMHKELKLPTLVP